MKIKANKVEYKHLLKHETKLHVLIRFSLVLLILIGYFIFISQKYGAEQGFFIAVLTWSFFVLCTPIADAGFILAFPIRLLLKVKMFYTQLASFVIAFLLNFYAFFFIPEIYKKTVILNLFHRILAQPFPFWGIILLSIIGTLFSIYFGDELIDVVKHSDREKYNKHRLKYEIITTIFIFITTLFLYNFLLKGLDIDLPI